MSPKALQKHAEASYANGFLCCEAVKDVIGSDFQVDVAESVNAMSSAMSIGAGCRCGALHGAMLALDMFFGRTTQAGPKAPRVNAVMAPLTPAGSPVP